MSHIAQLSQEVVWIRGAPTYGVWVRRTPNTQFQIDHALPSRHINDRNQSRRESPMRTTGQPFERVTEHLSLPVKLMFWIPSQNIDKIEQVPPDRLPNYCGEEVSSNLDLPPASQASQAL
jgi:hypothetical protein